MSFTLPIAESDVTSLVSDLALKAPKASPSFTGTVTVPNGVAATDILAYGQAPIPGSIGGPPKLVFRTADSATISSNITLADDDTLKWAVGANDRWLVQGFLVFTAADAGGAAATADIKTSFSVPAGGAMQHGGLGLPENTIAGYGSTTTSASPTALKAATQVVGEGAAAVSFGQAVSGYYTGGGTAGTVALTWAQNASNAATLLIAKNSLLLLWRIA